MKEKIKKIGLKAVRAAGDFAALEYDVFRRSEAMLKSGKEIVTKVDLGSEKIILDEIRKNFPEAGILSEEAGAEREEEDYFWVIDPIDGTTNFSIHNPLWAVSVGVFYKDELFAGFVYAPMLKEMFTAFKGQGAFLNGRKLQIKSIKKEKEIHTFCHGSRPIDRKRALQYYIKQKESKLDCRQLGAASIEFAYVAAGRVESIVIPGANSWDVAAGALLVREAGGKAADFSGEDWTLESRDIIGTNPSSFSEILKTLKSIR